MANENRLPAETKGALTRCIICGQFSRAIHYHHTVPRSLGGEHSLQIPIDGNCHTTLHAKAEAVVARLAGNRKQPIGQFWDDPDAEQRAEMWLTILVDAMLNPPVQPGQKEVLLPMIKVDLETRHALELLKRDTPGITNMGQVLRYCIETTLKVKGLKNGKSENPHSGHQSTRKKRDDLW
ncbi:hypothetical protein pEaSNUABM14_00340 [Erwinia phage pEa_SNUABM_14]|uniref:HNH endonuclease n=1 Tax=Erwinia phage pEa_SNUABM_7 TaxID=2866695 RepID=A0AAE7WSQ0_9CAUD|nr:hypothetical protein MPK74_gp343 [Erwinia phage pEa_SNUABM_7]QYW03299.1 hypothetical protein pEaSNUABM13_00341 [Erwinia phage pEa_SNUABM_13]QYW03640.1 hypothetical protein pEaSNUABM34_00338 [Erwinia phage pEa_SNUABM_34]QYW03981.1 hypothetical protein pEaSNUABM45_00338 [Erwinia phage pEa_SNUABM_45]QYW04322.1 hypothetical protein pEaSNUABM46_00338 [Erwinia phage pEa_SNUABM_46]QYW04665.1 hypothetical protein pEaSNUABM14_00340 [Erwinia phage pEa_SNUABM_14]QYW05353.1 hypothetical protein pEaSNU